MSQPLTEPMDAPTMTSGVKESQMALHTPAFLGPILFAPGSRTTWTAIDLIMRPLTPGEIDPRFIKVDPEAGPWTRDT